MMCTEASSSPEDTEPSSTPYAMTSNANFADYVERVQQNLAVFSLSDDAATTYLQKSNDLTHYNPRFITFEILFHEKVPQKDAKPKVTRRFDPHISDQSFEGTNPKNHIEDLKRLHANLKRFGTLDFTDAQHWSVPDYLLEGSQLSESTKAKLRALPKELEKLEALHEKFDRLSEEEINEIDEKHPDLDQLKSLLASLIKRYEVEYFPTHIGATAAIYEAWKQGKLIPLGNPEKDNKKFDKLIRALFFNTKGKKYASMMKEMAENLGLESPKIGGPEIRNIKTSEQAGHHLSNGRIWENSLEGKEWFVCLQISLIHKLRIEQRDDPTPANRYLIYYPLLIDDYWFAGVAFIYSELNVDPGEGDIPEIFNRKKYAKIYNTIQSVSDTLKIARWEDARQNATALLRAGTSKEEAFFEVAKDYFVCFSVGKEDDLEKLHQDSITNQYEIYAGHGIKILGPEWLSTMPEKLSLIKQEIDGYDVDVSHVKGIYELVEDLAAEIFREKNKTKQEGKEEGIEEQSKYFAHQVGGLIQEVWIDSDNLGKQAKTFLWHIRSVVEIWGTHSLRPDQIIYEEDFPAWRKLSNSQLLSKLIDMGLIHAMRRALRPHEDSNEIDKRTAKKVSEMRKLENPLEAFRNELGIQSLPDENLPDWVNLRGFVLCFHHGFWQAAYHGLRAKCGGVEPLKGSQNLYLKLAFSQTKLEIINAGEPFIPTQDKPIGDREFFQELTNRLEGKFAIEGPVYSDPNRWLTSILVN